MAANHLKKKNVKIILDIVMVCLLPTLMAYSLVGEKFHEIIGTVMFVLFIVHHVLNRNWYQALPKGKYNARRIFQTVLDFLLFAFMILQPVSGILMSKHLYTFLPTLSITGVIRQMHMLLAYWGFVLISIHAGTHLIVPFNKLKQKKKSAFITVVTIAGLISVYGICALIKRGFPGYMFGRTAFAFFDYSEPRIFFFADYVAILILFAVVGCLIVKGFSTAQRKK